MPSDVNTKQQELHNIVRTCLFISTSGSVLRILIINSEDSQQIQAREHKEIFLNSYLSLIGV